VPVRPDLWCGVLYEALLGVVIGDGNGCRPTYLGELDLQATLHPEQERAVRVLAAVCPGPVVSPGQTKQRACSTGRARVLSVMVYSESAEKTEPTTQAAPSCPLQRPRSVTSQNQRQAGHRSPSQNGRVGSGRSSLSTSQRRQSPAQLEGRSRLPLLLLLGTWGPRTPWNPTDRWRRGPASSLAGTALQ
jgi:hypothetical protein